MVDVVSDEKKEAFKMVLVNRTFKQLQSTGYALRSGHNRAFYLLVKNIWKPTLLALMAVALRGG